MATQVEMFTLEPDSRVERLRNWICLQWAFASIFWPTETQIVRMAQETRTLCETVMDECEREFERHCEPSSTGHQC
jgi:hypothetical protein